MFNGTVSSTADSIVVLTEACEYTEFVSELVGRLNIETSLLVGTGFNAVDSIIEVPGSVECAQLEIILLPGNMSFKQCAINLVAFTLTHISLHL